jgi:rare lipoprotein A
MQTKLRIEITLFAASLLSASMISTTSRATAAAANAKTHSVGIASWYGLQHQGLKMANGKRFDRRKMTAASWYVPLGTVLRVVNLENGKAVTVTVTDRGPNLRLHRIVDLSEAAARQLGYIEKGLTPVFVSPIFSYQPQHAEFRPALIEPAQPDLVATDVAPALLPTVSVFPSAR